MYFRQASASPRDSHAVSGSSSLPSSLTFSVIRRFEGVAGDSATIEKDAVALIEFRLGLDRERERVPFFERVDIAVERNDREVVANARAGVIVGPQERLERLVARREVLLGIAGR